VPLCPPQTSHAARNRTRAAAVGSQRLTDRDTARPLLQLIECIKQSVRIKININYT
jgi:hypothetical protein